MRRQRHYYTLIASLPAIPPIDQADRLPINPERLAERLKMLEPEDAETVRLAESYLYWRRQPIDRTDADVVAFYDEVMRTTRQPALRALFEFRLSLRSVMAALRRRHRGLPAPAPGERWGVGPYVATIERHWNDPHFKLAPVLPWLPEARRLLESGEVVALERLLMRLVWLHLDELVRDRPFSFDAVLVYLFKWDMLRRRLSYDATAARARFEALVDEVMHEHRELRFQPA